MNQTNPYLAPGAAPSQAIISPNPTTLSQVLFGFQGRIPRRTYWLWSIVSTIVLVGAMALILGLVAPPAADPASAEPTALELVVMVILYVPLVWISLALQVKRWHDRGKSGWWFLIGLIPFIGGIWVFVEAGCLRGDQGQNLYGPDPT